MPGPVWMGVEKRKCFAHTGVRTVGRYTVYALPPLFTFKDEVAAQIAVAWGCQNERYTRARTHTHTHTHTHTYFFLGSVQESQAERSCLSPNLGHNRTKENLKSGLINP